MGAIRLRPALAALLVAAAIPALATSGEATPDGVCESAVVPPYIKVGVAVDDDDPCAQNCPAMVNVNVAVSVSGDIEQCSDSQSLVIVATNAPLCRTGQSPWTAECQQLGWGLWWAVEGLLATEPCEDSGGPCGR